jgi:hypothetical protein
MLGIVPYHEDATMDARITQANSQKAGAELEQLEAGPEPEQPESRPGASGLRTLGRKGGAHVT